MGHFAKRAEIEEPCTKPHGATQQCLVSAAAMPQKSPPLLLLPSPRYGLVPVLGRRAPQAGVMLVHASCMVLVGDCCLVGFSPNYRHPQCRARQSTTSAAQRSSTFTPTPLDYKVTAPTAGPRYTRARKHTQGSRSETDSSQNKSEKRGGTVGGLFWLACCVVCCFQCLLYVPLFLSFVIVVARG